MSHPEQLIAEADQLAASGSALQAISKLRQAATLQPGNPYPRTRMADLLIQQGQLDEAKALLQSVIASVRQYSPAHMLLAQIAIGNGEHEAALASLDEAIRHDNSAWGARMEKARLLESLGGRQREAALSWSEAVRSMPEGLRESPQFAGVVAHARTLVTRNFDTLREFLQQRLDGLASGERGADLERFQHALDIITGRREFVTANPLFLPIPRLPAIPFFRREDFDWAPRVEAAYPDILDELRALPEADAGFTPYVQTRQGNSSGQFAALDRNPAWSAYFLWKHGERIEAHCQACPATAAAIEAAPLPRIRARAPAAFFSRLDPGVHIPPHNGATNARLTVHLPLVVPDGCAFRVGDETRQWVPGELMIFDDTILHEAWNGSRERRVVMIFDVWHPHLSPLERELVTRTVEGLVDYYGEASELGEL